MLIPVDEQIRRWGKVLVYWFSSNIGANNACGNHHDKNNFPLSVCILVLAYCLNLQFTANLYDMIDGNNGIPVLGGEFGLPLFDRAIKVIL